jgi:hypothetical protein
VERGGTLLLVNRQVLLDVPKLTSRPMSAYTTENVNRAERYNASNQPARALSPARAQHVLVGQTTERDRDSSVMRHETGERVRGALRPRQAALTSRSTT